MARQGALQYREWFGGLLKYCRTRHCLNMRMCA
jgi:hypothetical protein